MEKGRPRSPFTSEWTSNLRQNNPIVLSVIGRLSYEKPVGALANTRNPEKVPMAYDIYAKTNTKWQYRELTNILWEAGHCSYEFPVVNLYSQYQSHRFFITYDDGGRGIVRANSNLLESFYNNGSIALNRLALWVESRSWTQSLFLEAHFRRIMI